MKLLSTISGQGCGAAIYLNEAGSHDVFLDEGGLPHVRAYRNVDRETADAIVTAWLNGSRIAFVG